MKKMAFLAMLISSLSLFASYKFDQDGKISYIEDGLLLVEGDTFDDVKKGTNKIKLGQWFQSIIRTDKEETIGRTDFNFVSSDKIPYLPVKTKEGNGNLYIFADKDTALDPKQVLDIGTGRNF